MPKQNSRQASANRQPRRRPEAKGTLVKQEASAIAKAETPFPVVGIGSYSGGLEAVTGFLREIPAGLRMAYVVVQHQDPPQPDLALLAACTKMPVHVIRNGMRVKPDNVYVGPSGRDVRISDRILFLEKPKPAKLPHLSIDHFFASLAEDAGNRAIAIVLAGIGDDGTYGALAVRSQGGIVFAANAAAAGADEILAPAEIARRVGEMATHPYVQKDAPERELGNPFDSGKIFQLLREHSGIDFAQYRRGMLQRRLTRRMALNRIQSAGDYVQFLRGNADELRALFSDLLISVTCFFRDKTVFEALSRDIIPEVLKRKGGGGEIRLWVPGCATGEEAYSLAILVVETLRELEIETRVRIFGTDLDEMALAKARAGIYAPAALEEVSPERLERFFSKIDGSYQVSRIIRDVCTFACHNVCEDPPFSQLDLISCRNVLIYLGPEQQRRCVSNFHHVLNPGGVLVLGTSETTGQSGRFFARLDRQNRIYARKTAPLRPEAAASMKAEPLPTAERQRRGRGIATQISHGANQMASSGVVINDQLQVVQFRGQTGPFLEHAAGKATLNLLHMVKPGLAADLRAAIDKALERDQPVRKERLPLKIEGKQRYVDVEVAPFWIPDDERGRWLLVLFHLRSEQTSGNEKPGRKSRRSSGMEERLREELRATKEALHAIIEEHEATNEELKSANEEIESSNEELQTGNEELETANEELQSTNNELRTLNDELNTRYTEMEKLNRDLQNLLGHRPTGDGAKRTLYPTRYSAGGEGV